MLLDFGAARPVSAQTSGHYRQLLQAGLAGDAEAVKRAAVDAGILTDDVVRRHGAVLDRMIGVILREFERPGAFDFGDRAFVAPLRDDAAALAADRAAWHLPPVDMLFAQRKISGTALLAARLKARVDVHALLQEALGPSLPDRAGEGDAA